jgi:hypothetical protein
VERATHRAPLHLRDQTLAPSTVALDAIVGELDPDAIARVSYPLDETKRQAAYGE